MINLTDQQLLQRLEIYEARGYLRSQDHPTLPLKIWNYTEQAQFDGIWDEITIACRGLVTDINGKIVARPFPKFWNIEENKHKATEEFTVTEKMDGSLGIVFYYEGELVFATRGSFTSDQAVKAKEIFEKTEIEIYNWTGLDGLNTSSHFTYLFEIIYPENRIVVRYNEEKLVLLSIIETQTGKEVYRPAWGLYLDCPDWVEEYDCEDYTKLSELNTEGAEGFVVRFSNGDRCKIKFADYVRLHKIMTCASTISVWEMLYYNKSVNDALVGVPDEFYKLIKDYYDELKTQANSIEKDYKEMFAVINTPNRRKFAETVLGDRNIRHPQLMFQLYDKKDIRESVLKLIKPEFRKL